MERLDTGKLEDVSEINGRRRRMGAQPRVLGLEECENY